MKYASIDIETTGLDENFCQILSVGVVVEDTSKQLEFESIPKLHIVIPRKQIFGESFALNMNKNLIELINRYNMCKNPECVLELESENSVTFVHESNVIKMIKIFLANHGLTDRINVAGKNFTEFDKRFLKLLPDWNTLEVGRRVIDPAGLFVDWELDSELPDLNKCIERAGLEGLVSHNAVEDAFDVIRVLRTKYNK